MRKLTKFQVNALCGASLVLAFLASCASEESASDANGGSGNPFIIVTDTIKRVDENGDTIYEFKQDTVQKKIDTVMHITETGETTYVADTTYVTNDTTLRWVGNSALVITEILPLNLDWKDEDGNDGSWIEIYNAGSTDANLKGYALVENLQKPYKWVFGNEVIKAHSFRNVFCDNKDLAQAASGQDQDGIHYRTHTNWKLNKEGGTVYLIDPYYGIRDSVKFPELPGNVSWGIVDGGAWKYFDKPTPEARNTEATAYDGFAPAVNMDAIKAGFYNDAITLNPPKLPEGATMRCTQDGSVPTKNSQEFNSAITISKSTSFRCATFKDGTISKKIVTKTFLIGESVEMPVVAVSVDPSFFREHYIKTHCDAPKGCSDSAGLYADVEVPVHVEYFEKGSSSDGVAWETDAGASLMGGYSRLNDKKSLAVVLREEYEDGAIHYPLFETRKENNYKYKGFNLRNNGNRFVSDYVGDAMAGALLEGTSVDYQRSRQVVVFYNGEYYGIHDMRERFNKNFVETNYGVEANTVNFIKHLGKDITASNGTTADYEAMLAYIADNDFSGANNEKYAAVKTLIDVGNFADYMAAEIYFHNGDWPNNNVRAWRSPEHPWRFMVYDVDHGFDWMWGVNGGEFSQHNNMFEWIEKGGGNKPCKEKGCFANIYNQLIKNDDFKRLFLNHSAVMLHDFTNGENATKIVNQMTSTLKSAEMERDLDKFKQNEKYYQNSCGHGFDKEGACLKEWSVERDSKVLSEYQSEFGVGDLVSVKIASDGQGDVLMEGMKLPSRSYSGKFFSGLQMELNAVAETGAVFAGWSDGATENPHLVTITDGLSISASFK